MAHIPNIPRTKPLHWVGSAKKDYLDFPDEVQSDMGYALGLAQINSKHPKAKPWKGEGPGVFEIVEDHAEIPIERFTPCALLVLFMCCMPFRKNRRRELKRRSPTST
jgi:phage-related protein